MFTWNSESTPQGNKLFNRTGVKVTLFKIFINQVTVLYFNPETIGPEAIAIVQYGYVLL